MTSGPRIVRGFSLVELLVCIAVIAVLAGIVITVTGHAVSRSRLAQCSGNMRQWGIGIQLYANDNGGRFPQADEVTRNDNATQWQELIAPYILGEKPASNVTARSMMRARFPCPGNSRGGIVYGGNLSLSPLLNVNAPRRMIALSQNPAKFMLMAENYTGEVWDTRPWSGSSGVDYERHRSRGQDVANFLFADFHVKALSYQETLDLGVISRP